MERYRALRHMPDCAFLHSHPIEGDEAALCNCGAYEEAAGVWALEQQLAGAVDALNRIADIDPQEHSMTPTTARLQNAVAIAKATVIRIPRGRYDDPREALRDIDAMLQGFRTMNADVPVIDLDAVRARVRSALR